MRFQNNSYSLGNIKNDTIFNDSFYKEKLITADKNTNSVTYSSYEFVKKYFQATKINELINRTVKKTLDSSVLPENPYNMIGRLLLHEALFENTRIFYSLEGKARNRPNSGGLTAEVSLNSPASHQNLMAEIRSKNINLAVGWKIRNLIREDRLFFLWAFLFGFSKASKEKISSKNNTTKKSMSKILQISYCLGGSMILKTGCPYSAEETVSPNELIFTHLSDSNDHYTQFSTYVIDSCIKICESPEVVFIKIKIENYNSMAIEWSMDSLIHNRSKIIKQIVKNCITGLSAVKVEYLAKLPLQGHKVIGQSHIRVTKSFVLVQLQKNDAKIHCIQPTTKLFTHAFTSQSRYFESVINSTGKSTAEELIHELHGELHKYMIHSLGEQRQSWVGWCIFLYELYEFKDKNERDKELLSAITFMINSPLSFIEEILHEVNTVKLVSSRQSTSHNELQIFEILEKINNKIGLHLQKQEHVYPESVVFFEAAKENIELILDSQKGKPFSIKPILERVQLMIRYLISSFNQISFVLKGHLLNEIIRIDNEFGKEGSGEVITKTVTYDIFLRKYKKMPDRNLNLQEEIKKLRIVFERPDQDIRELILAKYVKQYQLYEKIYDFYWGIICGKKLNYPMSRFVNILRNQAIKFDCKKAAEKEHLDLELEEHRADGIMIYQKAADSKGQFVFYALAGECLEDHKIRDYHTLFQIFNEHFQVELVYKKSMKAVAETQRSSSLISINTNVSRGKWEESDFNKCKLYIDVIYHVPVNKQQIYKVMFEEIKQKLSKLEKNGFGIIGLYIGEPQHIDEDQVYPWIEQQQKFDIHFIRYYSKKPLEYESFSKYLLNCIKQNAEVIVRCVFWFNGLLKSCILSFNFLINEEWLLNLSHTYEERVFGRYDDVMRWGNYNGLKRYLATRKEIEENPNFDKVSSSKQLYRSNHIDMIRFVVEVSNENLNIKKVRGYSPFYSMLEQALSLCQSLFFLLEFLKTDREGKFEIQDFKDTIELLEYYLFEKCLHSDRYIYSEGLSVTIINLVEQINSYIDNHPDNNGDEKQLIYLQKITVRLMNCVQYALTSCVFGVIEAIKSDFLDDDEFDNS